MHACCSIILFFQGEFEYNEILFIHGENVPPTKYIIDENDLTNWVQLI